MIWWSFSFAYRKFVIHLCDICQSFQIQSALAILPFISNENPCDNPTPDSSFSIPKRFSEIVIKKSSINENIVWSEPNSIEYITYCLDPVFVVCIDSDDVALLLGVWSIV